MIPKITILSILLSLILIFSCKEEIEIQYIIEVSTESIDTDGGTVRIKSKVNIESNQITEHGHYWSNDPELSVTSESVMYSCLGPLTSTKDFTDEIELSDGTFYIGAYIIVNEYFIHSQSEKIKIQFND